MNQEQKRRGKMWSIICVFFLPCLLVFDHLGFSGGAEADCGVAANSRSANVKGETPQYWTDMLRFICMIVSMSKLFPALLLYCSAIGLNAGNGIQYYFQYHDVSN